MKRSIVVYYTMKGKPKRKRPFDNFDDAHAFVKEINDDKDCIAYELKTII